MKKKDELIVRRDVSLAKRLYKCWPLYVFLLPGLIWYIMFCYKPMIGLRMAFYDYNIFRGFSGSKFVGLENFKIYMSSPVVVSQNIGLRLLSRPASWTFRFVRYRLLFSWSTRISFHLCTSSNI